MADVSVIIHVPERNGIPYDMLQIAITELVKTVHSNVEVVTFAKGNENPEGINAIQIRTALGEGTKQQLEQALGFIFDKKFEISFNSEMQYLNRGAEITSTARRLKRLFHSA